MMQDVDLSTKSCLVIDNGLFVGFARYLKKTGFGKVWYHCPGWKSARPVPNDAFIGSGFPEIECVLNKGDYIRKADVIAFPDVLHGDEQVDLVSRGKAVWGSRKGEDMELYRYFSKKMMEAVGLPVSKYKRVVGLDALRGLLKESKDVFVKFSLFRGSCETWHHEDYRITEYRLDELEHRLGPFKQDLEFLVEWPIKTKIEVGYDGYFVGQFPKLAGQGYEIKDAGLVEIMMEYDALPEEVRSVNDALSETLADYGYQNWISTEIRVGEDGTPYPIDLTLREAAPAGESMLRVIKNLAEIVYHGAHGKLVEMDLSAACAAQAMIYSDRDERQWQPVLIDPKGEDYVFLYNHLKRKGVDFAIPRPAENTDPYAGNEIGTVVGEGATPEEAIENCKKNCKFVEGDSLTIKTEAMDKALEEIGHAEEQGMSVEPVSI